LKERKEYFPFDITNILTDNGLEFTDRFVGKTKEVSVNHKFDKEFYSLIWYSFSERN